MRIILLALVLALLLPSLPAKAYFLTGNKLHEMCTSQEGRKRWQCLGYVQGIVDGQTYVQQFWSNPLKYCAPPTTTVGQVTDIVKKYLSDHPEARHHDAASLATAALREAFPCPS